MKITGGRIKLDAGGEGSRGGHVIGHTSSGKPIYASHHGAHKSFTAKDHKEAADLHSKKAAEAESESYKIIRAATRDKQFSPTPEQRQRLGDLNQADVHHRQRFEHHYVAAGGDPRNINVTSPSLRRKLAQR